MKITVRRNIIMAGLFAALACSITTPALSFGGPREVMSGCGEYLQELRETYKRYRDGEASDKEVERIRSIKRFVKGAAVAATAVITTGLYIYWRKATIKRNDTRCPSSNVGTGVPAIQASTTRSLGTQTTQSPPPEPAVTEQRAAHHASRPEPVAAVSVSKQRSRGQTVADCFLCYQKQVLHHLPCKDVRGTYYHADCFVCNRCILDLTQYEENPSCPICRRPIAKNAGDDSGLFPGLKKGFFATKRGE